MTSAAVWGASGFVGGALASTLESRGWHVRRLGRAAVQSAAHAHPLQWESSPAEMANALARIDVAFNCAGPADDDAEGFAAYEAASARFAGAAASCGARLVHLSTVAVYGPRDHGRISIATPVAPATLYAKSRAGAEAAVLAAAASAARPVVVRIPMVVGDRMKSAAIRNFCRTLRTGWFFHPGPPDAVLNCIGIDRLAHLLAALADRPLERGTLQFADNIAWTTIAAIYAELHTHKVRRMPVPRWAAAWAAHMLTGRPATEGLAALANRAIYECDAAARLPDLALAPSTLQDLRRAVQKAG